MVQSSLHFGLVELFRAFPELALELLRRVEDRRPDLSLLEGPPFTGVRADSPDLSVSQPTDRIADGLIVLEGPRPVVVILEVQVVRDDEKPERWLSYVLSSRLRYRCEVILLVVSPSARVARWARRPIEVGAGMRLCPVVVGPHEIPSMTSHEEARRMPVLSVLSALAHPENPAVVETTLDSALRLLGPAAAVYWDLIYDGVAPALKRLMEESMAAENAKYEFKSPFARSYFDAGKAEGEALGKAEGEALGKAQGEALGKAQGEALGKAAGKAQAVLAILQARGLAVPYAARDLIMSTTSEPILDTWLVRAISAARAEDLFD